MIQLDKQEGDPDDIIRVRFEEDDYKALADKQEPTDEELDKINGNVDAGYDFDDPDFEEDDEDDEDPEGD